MTPRSRARPTNAAVKKEAIKATGKYQLNPLPVNPSPLMLTLPMLPEPVTETSFGAMEPADGRVLDPSEVDLVIVPGVAFDRSGNRLGFGAGYYDRFLPRTAEGTPAVAIAFALQVVPEVPTGAMDRRVDAIVTEAEVIRCRP